MHNSYSTAGHNQGFFTSGGGDTPCSGSPQKGGYQLIEGNILYHNGWYDGTTIPGSQDTIYNRNMYLTGGWGNTEVIENIDASGASGGIQLRMGGLIENNLVLRSPVAMSFGHTENPAGSQTSGTMRYNVIIDSRDIKGTGRGYGAGQGGVNKTEIYGNIFTHQKTGT